MNLLRTILFLALITALGCQSTSREESKEITNAQLIVRANELAHRFIIADTHIDFPYRLNKINFNIEEDKSILIQSQEGNFDYERAKKGGLDAAFMSIYIPASYQHKGGAKNFADELIDMVYDITEAYPDKFAIATSPQQIAKHFKEGKVSLPMGMENGAPIGNDLNNLAYFHKRGIRYITLTHSEDNQICDSSYDTTRTWNGLSPFGKEVVQEMNDLGIMVDISHVTDSTFYQVMEISKAPVIASHSSCRHFTPGFERNMSDDMIKVLGENGGVIQITFGSSFIDKESRLASEQINDYLKLNNLDREDSLAKAYISNFAKNNPVFSNVKRVADHIDHVVKLVGIDHVGLGSDFDGVGDTLPEGLKDVSHYPNLIAELLRRGYTEEDIEKICSKNLFRVWNKVEDVANQR